MSRNKLKILPEHKSKYVGELTEERFNEYLKDEVWKRRAPSESEYFEQWFRLPNGLLAVPSVSHDYISFPA